MRRKGGRQGAAVGGAPEHGPLGVALQAGGRRGRRSAAPCCPCAGVDCRSAVGP